MIKFRVLSKFRSDSLASSMRTLLSAPLPVILLLLMFAGNGWGQLIPFNENFSYPAGNLSGQNGWTYQILGTDNTNPIQVTSPGLFFPGYLASGIGLAATYGNTSGGQDLFKNFTGTSTINTGSVYIAALVKVTSANRFGDYFRSKLTH